MTTTTVECENPEASVLPINLNPMRVCMKCGMKYEWKKSSSKYLRMSFCGFLCEVSENGATIEEMIATTRDIHTT